MTFSPNQSQDPLFSSRVVGASTLFSMFALARCTMVVKSQTPKSGDPHARKGTRASVTHARLPPKLPRHVSWLVYRHFNQSWTTMCSVTLPGPKVLVVGAPCLQLSRKDV